MNHKPVDNARKGMEVCAKIEPTGGEAPRLYGRHFDHTDMLVSKVGYVGLITRTRQHLDFFFRLFNLQVKFTCLTITSEKPKLVFNYSLQT